MYDCTRNYINGEWVTSTAGSLHDIINPATERSVGKVAFGTAEDVGLAVAAAKNAFESFSAWSVEQRIELLGRIVDAYKARWNDIAAAITAEMGAPAEFALRAQAGSGLGHLRAAITALQQLELEQSIGNSVVVREPVGVCGLITPWNWPINQIACKVAPALAAGCTVILKPSEIAPVNASLFAEVLHDAGVPAGVFNLVHGDGPGAGAALSDHPDIDMMSFTGSTRAGVLVAKAAASTVKRVAQELGGKSANIILPNAPLEEAVTSGVHNMFHNSGQSCNAPSRMLVPESSYEEAVAIAARVAESTRPGDPSDPETHIGPVISEAQYQKIQGLIEAGMAEGAKIAAGGPGKPKGLETGYYVKPTLFRDVNNDMTIAREEIFGPVLCMLSYSDIDQAVRIANDSVYGLSGYVWGGSTEEAMAVARRLRTGMVHLNGAPTDVLAPFGGYKQSGNGREWGIHGLEDFLEIKAVMGA
ncbi:MAG: aldehyde dehydrogenase family protein [Xanthomonadales bacterium]|nr:aldehyde dehydrogenase family protein [Gammaproteobacteria bacterium]MBT8054455.1 aldehyde dehydrogenase family protein [Gammaproteobacteria bacterium]NND58469.1 aldehyde dehydrogenase family protein [Xanthomonadales bacterium]NNK50110.1 aldehyde dehydrogenase family protein [Xanthomonadales bacterium]